ncbi:hypothetical protein DEF28_14205 [Marinitenerispora sediminis]|uniref:Glycosyltransferase subfamily 4-like N-terminal domain-containing protein n=1 Tax=Marinitenerispora sediminis TaxID=1931232 RepID=A0A368T498_9ACTN|nr:hypothetical protein DEF28_14205 [Marinitenerispora sediminis]RCV58197.1 hypothetical protein DEF24_14060 [Marinitenerispora sediminis]
MTRVAARGPAGSSAAAAEAAGTAVDTAAVRASAPSSAADTRARRRGRAAGERDIGAPSGRLSAGGEVGWERSRCADASRAPPTCKERSRTKRRTGRGRPAGRVEGGRKRAAAYSVTVRIGLFTDYYLPAVGGVQTLVAAQHRLLAERGHGVTVVCASYGSGRDHRATDVIHLPSAARLEFDQHRPYLPLPHRQRRLVAEMARRGGVDIVHGHTEFGVSVAARAVARAFGAPYVVTMHTLMHRQMEDTFADPLAWSRRLLTFQRLMLRPGPDTYRPVGAATAAQHNVWRFMVRHANTADAVVVPSRHFAEKLAERGVRPPLHVVPNVTAAVRRRTAPPGDGEPTIVWVGRLSPEKRILPFLQALRTLPGAGWRAEVYGGGVQEEECRAFLAAHPMPGVRLLGARPHADVLAALERADIAVITSHGFDNHPMAVVEAVAAGLPILACDPDLSEGVTPDNAVLTAPDPAAIGAGLTRLVRDPGLRATLAAGSRRLAARYTGERFAERLEAVYREALAGRRTARSGSL